MKMKLPIRFDQAERYLGLQFLARLGEHLEAPLIFMPGSGRPHIVLAGPADAPFTERDANQLAEICEVSPGIASKAGVTALPPRALIECFVNLPHHATWGVDWTSLAAVAWLQRWTTPGAQASKEG